MSLVKVYRFRKYDISTDDYHYSTRLATPEKITLIRFEILKATETEIDGALLDDGWTAKGFVSIPTSSTDYTHSQSGTARIGAEHVTSQFPALATGPLHPTTTLLRYSRMIMTRSMRTTTAPLIQSPECRTSRRLSAAMAKS